MASISRVLRREPKNYWMHCGASIGICQGAGAGKYLAQWMVHGQAEINMREFDPRRFGDWATTDYTRRRRRRRLSPHVLLLQAGRTALRSAAICANPRCTRGSKAEGAQFAQIFGWERARWYACGRHRRRALFLQSIELVGGGEGRGAGGSASGRAHGPLDVLEIRRAGAGRPRLPRTDLRQQNSGERWRH